MEEEEGIRITLTQSAGPALVYSLSPAEVIPGVGVAKTYDGYRMVWGPNKGFVAIFPGDDERNSSKPEPGLIIKFREDLKGEAAGNIALGAYLTRNSEEIAKSNSISWKESHVMPPDRFARSAHFGASGDLPPPAAFRKPIVAETGAGPRKRTL